MSDVTAEQLVRALNLVRVACNDCVEEGRLSPTAFAHIDQWLQRLPTHKQDPKAVALNLAFLVGQPLRGGDGDVDGVLVDSLGRASLEALVLHYEAQEASLFPSSAVEMARARLASHGGPRYTGPWP